MTLCEKDNTHTCVHFTRLESCKCDSCRVGRLPCFDCVIELCRPSFLEIMCQCFVAVCTTHDAIFLGVNCVLGSLPSWTMNIVCARDGEQGETQPYLLTVIYSVLVQTLPTEQATQALTDSFSRGHDPSGHACKARPLTIVAWTSLSVSMSMSSWCFLWLLQLMDIRDVAIKRKEVEHLWQGGRVKC